MHRLVAIAAFLTLAVTPAIAAGGFGDWAAIVVAGDWHAHSGAPSEVFDNARRDVSADLVGIGFDPSDIEQFSVRPDKYPLAGPRAADPDTIATSLWDLTNRADGGCLAYFTSHGSPDGIVMGDGLLAPDRMNDMISNACGDKPTVVIVSACFSGVFVPVLAAPNRLILTAARPDRTSFGCGEQDRYTFFDTCILSYFRSAGDFPDLAKDAIDCVAAREKKDGFLPHSEPQLYVGSRIAAELPAWK